MIGKCRSHPLAHPGEPLPSISRRAAFRKGRRLRWPGVSFRPSRESVVLETIKPVQTMRQHLGCDVVHAFFGQVRSDLEEDRKPAGRFSRLIVPGGKHGRKQRRETLARLQIAQPGVLGEEMLR